LKAHFPGRPTIDAYGAGGFRFAGMSHRGSILALPSGVYGWEVSADALSVEDFAAVLSERGDVDLLLFGSGAGMLRPPQSVREAIAATGMMLDCMTTGAAVSTYNLLLEERRKVAAALIAVDRPA
jgi:uncharacterized protein